MVGREEWSGFSQKGSCSSSARKGVKVTCMWVLRAIMNWAGARGGRGVGGAVEAGSTQCLVLVLEGCKDPSSVFAPG